MSPPRSILDLTPDALAAELSDLGEPSYRAGQILRWVYKDRVGAFADMTNLPRALRERLESRLAISPGREATRSTSPDGTLKLLVGFTDGATAECVMIPAPGDDGRRTLCVSTQVGCDVGCRFCASGLEGALRNLTVGEILAQAWIVSGHLEERGERLTNVVFMGMGEPLANYRATVEAVRRLNADWGFNIGQRRITISTVGLPKQIERLAGEGLQTTLALSLHAANETLRSELIPWAKRLSLKELLAACEIYLERTGREVTLEYCLLAGVNDRERDVADLARIARDLRAHVNLMMYNAVEGLPFKRPQRAHALGFLKGLRERGVNAHLRESRGLEADAACGQLRRRVASRLS